ncbi:PTS fructose transporter subunit IIABC [Corynebacterium minutissimum]|uniref:Fructose specific PTS system component n=1 Tax=Corynebacterium minutissimum TaxID=38301 RepID=A0A2X4RTT7_9CORY|nr:fructose-specific PTS transporter subunit EIIC [Corynebacterium minutissimum]KHO28977.1 PTS lactose transporter subunit IIC [Corynebacterium minutissimum]QPS59115.1 PTS sugar transporter subunit IIA [Corynebacterium minutissimum]QQA80096.1 PTS sugar transporter subunit IIA [Corynebacterium minutissimum]SQH99710.1 fructose specific PTS system component [Corynebacterium minutissimum]VEG06223.1 fructose specific PTS system component [Corynebacterium minutissimum]
MASDLITTDLVALDADFGDSIESVITNLATLVHDTGRASSVDELAAPAIARETKAGTGVPGGVAIPHCRSAAVTEPTLAFARLSRGVDFSGPDGDAQLVFLIAAPEGGGKAHLKILSKLARALVKKDFLEALRNAETKDEIVKVVLDVVNAEKPKKKAVPAESAAAGATVPASTSSSASTDEAKGSKKTRIVAVTACPTGIAHTYMAADALTQTAEERDDVELTVETQGSSNNTAVSANVIENADAVIFAADVGVRDRERFAGKPVIESGVKRAINEPGVMIDEAIAASKNPNAHKVSGTAGAASSNAQEEGEGLGWGKRIQQAIMTGVSYMVPFVAAGGLLLALGFLLGGYDVANGWQAITTDYSLTNLPGHDVVVDGATMTFKHSGLGLYLGAVLFAIGQAAMGFIVAALSGYIAFALAGRPGIAPGFAGGAIAVTLGAGFIGGLVTGLIAGFVAMWIGKWKVPRWVGSLMPVVIIPLLATMITGLLMYLLLGAPLAAIMNGLQNWLASMSGSSAVLLGIILGLMMCSDLGGPVNKAAYLFATAGLSTGDEASMKIMAAVMASGMVAPIALSIATFVRKNLFTPAEQENGKSAWLLGLSFVSEGAIPFAAADPLRVIPSMMLGGAVTGALSMALGVMSRAPHGGIFVIFAIEPAWAYFVAILAGVAVAAIAVIAMKQFWPNKTAEEAAAKAETAKAAA